VTAPTEITEEEMEAAGIVEEEPEEAAEEAVQEGPEEGEEEPSPEEGEGPAGQNLQA
jgi:large subunit ribosomal protein L25